MSFPRMIADRRHKYSMALSLDETTQLWPVLGMFDCDEVISAYPSIATKNCYVKLQLDFDK